MKQVITVILSFLLLLSSTGITYAQHFCGDLQKITKITFGQEFLSCEEGQNEPVCCDEKQKGHNCCDNKYSQIDIDDNFTSSEFNSLPELTAMFNSDYFNQAKRVDVTQVQLVMKYHSPPLIRNFPVLFEQFLI